MEWRSQLQVQHRTQHALIRFGCLCRLTWHTRAAGLDHTPPPPPTPPDPLSMLLCDCVWGGRGWQTSGKRQNRTESAYSPANDSICHVACDREIRLHRLEFPFACKKRSPRAPLRLTHSDVELRWCSIVDALTYDCSRPRSGVRQSTVQRGSELRELEGESRRHSSDGRPVEVR